MRDFIADVHRFAETATEAEIREKLAELRIYVARLRKARWLSEGERNALYDAERAIRVLEEYLLS